ncbi:hypothetical protein Pcinc_004261 [Petrolisthes cinctipes]|uniref:Uncharacterized protein n=1 Tax=Petrolisthes cinctipes TaxID=88211 RepID=A0AAE1L194_PETCI|nr:hypothetical protein Pcinc_004261 [Petrolisthes cinctipes]
MSEKVAETEDEDTEFVRKVSDDENSKVLGSLEGLTEAKNESDRTTMIERVRKLITYNIGGDILHKTKKAAADKIREGATEGCESDSETLGVNRSLETEFKKIDSKVKRFSIQSVCDSEINKMSEEDLYNMISSSCAPNIALGNIKAPTMVAVPDEVREIMEAKEKEEEEKRKKRNEVMRERAAQARAAKAAAASEEGALASSITTTSKPKKASTASKKSKKVSPAPEKQEEVSSASEKVSPAPEKSKKAPATPKKQKQASTASKKQEKDSSSPKKSKKASAAKQASSVSKKPKNINKKSKKEASPSTTAAAEPILVEMVAPLPPTVFTDQNERPSNDAFMNKEETINAVKSIEDGLQSDMTIEDGLQSNMITEDLELEKIEEIIQGPNDAAADKTERNNFMMVEVQENLFDIQEPSFYPQDQQQPLSSTRYDDQQQQTCTSSFLQQAYFHPMEDDTPTPLEISAVDTLMTPPTSMRQCPTKSHSSSFSFYSSSTSEDDEAERKIMSKKKESRERRERERELKIRDPEGYESD